MTILIAFLRSIIIMRYNDAKHYYDAKQYCDFTSVLNILLYSFHEHAIIINFLLIFAGLNILLPTPHEVFSY